MNLYVSSILIKDLSSVNIKIRNKCLLFWNHIHYYSVGYGGAGHFPVSCCSRIWNKVITSRDRATVIKILKNLGAINVYGAGTYITGARCKAYSLGARYLDSIESIKVDHPILERNYLEAFENADHLEGPYKYLMDCYLNRSSFSENAVSVRDAEMLNSEGPVRMHFAMYFEKFDMKSKRCKISQRSGRFYYVPDLMAKELRHEVLIDGEPTETLDVSASQPTLAATLYPSDCEEKDKYLELINTGDFYETIYREAEGPLPNKERHEIKEAVFTQVFYARADSNYHMFPLWNSFRKRYPDLSDLILRERHKLDEKGRLVRGRLAVRLQSLEARIFIDGVVAECAQKDVPLLSLHDGVAVSPRDVDAVREMIRAHWLLQTGREPKIKHEKRILAPEVPTQPIRAFKDVRSMFVESVHVIVQNDSGTPCENVGVQKGEEGR